MKFCNKCNNILEKNTNNDILTFVCTTCCREKNAEPEDTLMLNVSFKNNKNMYKSDIYLNIAAKDPIAPNIKENCINCNETIIKRISDYSGKALYICPNCNKRFVKN
jgi:DNA-directed RNA polymerase subunit M/transcription elongation factor TFIIS